MDQKGVEAAEQHAQGARDEKPGDPTAAADPAERDRRAVLATEAATAKEISMPPAISTTNRPTAKMMLTALMFRRSKALPSEKKFAVAKESTA